jgi:hypothetical protein
VNDWNAKSICSSPVYDYSFTNLNFYELEKDFPKDFKRLVKAFKERCDYMKKHFKNYPALELFITQKQMTDIVIRMSALLQYPF